MRLHRLRPEIPEQLGVIPVILHSFARDVKVLRRRRFLWFSHCLTAAPICELKAGQNCPYSVVPKLQRSKPLPGELERIPRFLENSPDSRPLFKSVLTL